MFSRRVRWVGILYALCLVTATGYAKEYHVAVNGSDQNPGSASKPFKTISVAAEIAQPGDVITVHAGTYRERINPPRGGESDTKRITYQAAKGENVVIKGSEVMKGWMKVENDTWKISIPNSFFGDFNPYGDLIRGDWFNGKGRQHHTGAVYLNDHWLTEAIKLDDVLKPVGHAAAAYIPGQSQYLLNVAWFRPVKQTSRTSAGAFAAQHGIQTEPNTEGGKNVGWIEHGDWVRYDKVDFGQDTNQMEIRASSATHGGIIEIRLDTPDGELLGMCPVPNTGGWHMWSSFKAKIKPVSGTKTICMVFTSQQKESVSGLRLWFAQVDAANTTIWAQFKDINPNEANVEINVRQAIFYPEKPGMNYITVRGFTMMHAATNWAPPTAEQVGLIGTHWSKGWIIEDNDIRYSICTGVTLGKYGDEYDNTSANSAKGYVKTIERGLASGWSKDNIGSHIVRNNRISHCEQAGIVGSLGAIFSTVTGNTIHDIHIRQLFTGAEMAGIKFHGAVDSVISHNHIYRTNRGIWLDWMTQGTRISRNLLHDNDSSEDMFMEVNHGPFLVDNNIMLSRTGLLVNSQGGAYVHNLFNGRIRVITGERRLTPHLKEHGTEVVGLAPNSSGDDRFYNNIFVNGGLAEYDRAILPVFMDGNVFLKGAKPSKHETDSIIQQDADPNIKLLVKDEGVFLHINLDKTWSEKQVRRLVTTELLGKAKIPNLPYVQPDSSPYRIDTDYFGRKRSTGNPSPGPFEYYNQGKNVLKIWLY